MTEIQSLAIDYLRHSLQSGWSSFFAEHRTRHYLESLGFSVIDSLVAIDWAWEAL